MSKKRSKKSNQTMPDLGFASGVSLAKAGATVEKAPDGMTMEELVPLAYERAKAGGCTCSPFLHIGSRGVEILHHDQCPRLKTIGVK